MQDWLRRLPKAELHLHIEGTLEPSLMFELAAKNAVALPYKDVAAVEAAYQFDNLQGFLDLYYQGMAVLLTADDFYALAIAYLGRAHDAGVVHVELSFDPQPHLALGVPLAAQFDGLQRAMRAAHEKWGMSCALIMSFLRDQSAASALEVLAMAAPWYDAIAAIGLDSAERGNPPEKFVEVFARAAELGIARTAHAGEEGPAANIRNSLDLLDVCRIDHGVSCIEDAQLVALLAIEQIPLTVCPLSNLSLKVVDELAAHPVQVMLDAGLNVSINSDDPAYFGGGMLANFMACANTLGWDKSVFRQLARNAVGAAFMNEARRQQLLADIAAC